MNYKEIIQRESPQYISVKEMEFVVEQYILQRTGEVVTINSMRDADNIFLGRMVATKGMASLNYAYDIAASWLMKNQ